MILERKKRIKRVRREQLLAMFSRFAYESMLRTNKLTILQYCWWNFVGGERTRTQNWFSTGLAEY